MSQDLGRFEKIFDTCLESILSGQESLDSVLAKTPQLAAELRPRLEVALVLTSSKHLFEPAPDFIPRSRQSLMSRVQGEPQVPTAGGILAWLAGLLSSLEGIRFSPQFTAVAVTMAVIMILITGGSVTALFAERSLPGDALYPVKNALEDARLGLASNPADQASLNLGMARRRAAEIGILSREKRWELIQAVIADYEWHLNEAVRQIKLIVPQQAERARELAQVLEQMMISHQTLLETAAQGMPEQARQSVEHALSMNADYLLFAQDVIGQTDLEINPVISPATLTPTPTATPTATSSALPDVSASKTIAASVVTTTGTPGTLAATTLTPSPTSLFASPTPTRTPAPTLTATSPPPTLEAVVPTPTKKPTKTPKPLPNPTRRPPHPTPKD